MLRLRHPSSLQVRGVAAGTAGDSGFCGAAGPGAVPSERAAPGDAGTGGRKRGSPVGGSAYRIPRKLLTGVPSTISVAPRTDPLRLKAGFMVDTLRPLHG